MCWPGCERLCWELATGNFGPENIAPPGAFTPQEPAARSPSTGTCTSTPPPDPARVPPGRDGRNTQTTSQTQKPWPATHLKVDLDYQICRTINAAADFDIGMPETDDSRHFCLSCNLKGVCNSNCGGRNSHRTMNQGEMGRMMEWRNFFHAEEPPPPVIIIDTEHYGGGGSIASSISSQSLRS